MRIIVGIGVALAAFWLVMVAALLLVRPRGASARDAARLAPDTLRLLRDLATDRGAPRGVRIRLGVLLAGPIGERPGARRKPQERNTKTPERRGAGVGEWPRRHSHGGP